VDGLTDVEAGQINDDLFGNAVGGTIEFDFMTHDVENAAGLETGGCLMIAEMHRHLDANARILAEPQEIHVDDEVAHGLELNIARDDSHRPTGDVEIDQRGGEAAGVHVG
jgi:hypothetical protein